MKRNRQERELKNDDLREVVRIAKQDGCRIYTFDSSSRYIEQIFIESKNGQVGTCSATFGGVQFSTVHKSERGSGNGTGFGNLIAGQEIDRPEQYRVCFSHYPYWQRETKGKVYKYTSWEDYLEKSLGILTYYEL